MKYLRNGQSSRLVTPVWPVMRGYGAHPFDPSTYIPSAGPNGGYEPSFPTMFVVGGGEEVYETPYSPVGPPAEAPTTPTEAPVVGTAPGPSTAEGGALPGAETSSEAAPHPYETGGTATGAEGPAPGGGAVIPEGEYVGGTEVGPEAGIEVSEERPVWPIVVGVGACVGLVALIGLAAWGASR